MLKNYLITAIAILVRNKLYSLINICGLAAGIAAFILIILFVRHETSFDKHWQDADRITLMTMEMTFPPGSDPRRMTDFTSMFAPDAFEGYFEQEIESAVMTVPFGERFRLGDISFEGRVKRVDKSILDMFQFETLVGDLAGTFTDPGNIALSEEEAIKLFGNANPVGEVLAVENDANINGVETVQSMDFRVTAVYRLPTGNTVLDLPALALLEERPLPPVRGFFIRISGSQYFIKLKPGVSADSMETRLRDFVEGNATQFIRTQTSNGSPLDMVTLHLEPLDEHYFDPLPGLNSQGSGSRDAVRIYSAVSVLVLVIGCINFVILSTAKSTQRAKEVAMRKVLGAKPAQLVRQFLGEALILTTLAVVLALLLVALLLPFFENFLALSLQINYASLGTWLFIAVLLAAVALLGGMYPALVLSRFSPDKVLRSNQSNLSDGSIRMRSVLVVFQFAISIALIVATLIVSAQLAFIKLDPGYNPENMMVMRTRMGISINTGIISYQGVSNIDTLKQEILGLPEVIDTGFSGAKPNEILGFFSEFKTSGSAGRDPVATQMPVNNVGFDFFSTYQIPLVAGRDFALGRDQEMPPMGPFRNPEQEPLSTNILLNEAAVRQLEFPSPEAALGQTVTFGNNITAEIIGVVANTRFADLWQASRPEAYQLNPSLTVYMTIRYQGESQNIRDRVEGIWSRIAPDYPYNVSFLEQELDQAFSSEENLGRVFMLLSLLAVLISAMGLYGMASFTVDRRIKEIGIRKVMGARVSQIVTLLMAQFSLPVLLSCFIAWPAALYFIQDWLVRFPFQIDFTLQLWYCLLAGIAALVIACLTVAGNTLRVANSNPVDALRYE